MCVCVCVCVCVCLLLYKAANIVIGIAMIYNILKIDINVYFHCV